MRALALSLSPPPPFQLSSPDRRQPQALPPELRADPDDEGHELAQQLGAQVGHRVAVLLVALAVGTVLDFLGVEAPRNDKLALEELGLFIAVGMGCRIGLTFIY